jgi:hypothetical protein
MGSRKFVKKWSKPPLEAAELRFGFGQATEDDLGLFIEFSMCATDSTVIAHCCIPISNAKDFHHQVGKIIEMAENQPKH